MAIIRTIRNQNYTTMACYHLRDKKLSLKAKGLMSFMLQLPDTWKYSIKGLASALNVGRDQIRSAVQELITAGYLCREYRRDENGQIIGAEYLLFESPLVNEHISEKMSGNPVPEKPTAAQPMTEKLPQLNINSNNSLNKIKEENNNIKNRKRELLIKIGFRGKNVDELIEKFSFESIKAGVRYVEACQKKQRIINPPGLLYQILVHQKMTDLLFEENYISCPTCHGSGMLNIISEDNYDSVKICSTCHGTGKIRKGENEK